MAVVGCGCGRGGVWASVHHVADADVAREGPHVHVAGFRGPLEEDIGGLHGRGRRQGRREEWTHTKAGEWVSGRRRDGKQIGRSHAEEEGGREEGRRHLEGGAAVEGKAQVGIGKVLLLVLNLALQAAGGVADHEDVDGLAGVVGEDGGDVDVHQACPPKPRSKRKEGVGWRARKQRWKRVTVRRVGEQ